jgi:hypothetical protein
MSDPTDSPQDECSHQLQRVQRRLRVLTVAILLLALIFAMQSMAVYGSLVNYWNGDAFFYGGTSIVAGLLGFGFGWFARRRA